MKKHTAFALHLLFAGITASSFAQVKDPQILMTVGKQPVTLAEFKSMYYKNLPKDSIKSQKALNNYLNLFIEFRLKVNAALDAKLDTTPSFTQEMAEYRGKLAEPYMRDQNVEDMLIKEAYDRMHTDVRASHILIKVGPDAAPEDTLAAYKKIMGIRSKIVKKQLTFEKAAEEYSDDTYSKANGGDLGYFTSLEMVYPFETAAYTQKISEISMPIRTKFGYHLIKVTDKRPDAGEVKVAHIMLRTPPHMGPGDSAKIKNRIDSIYNLIKQGGNFADLAMKYSQDPSSGRMGGVLPQFGVGRMPAPFEKASFSLKNIGDVSQPVRTRFGWHIIKLIDRKSIPPFDSIKDAITERVEKDTRSELATKALIAEVKKKYDYKENTEAVKAFYKVVDASFYSGKWNADKAKGLTDNIFTIGGISVTQRDFAQYLAHHQMSGENKGGEYAVNILYPKFADEECLKYKNAQLEREYPAFAEMLQEYRDGILLFDITDKMVWSKALQDTSGLKKFYEDHKTNYMWPERADASIYTCTTSKIAKEVKKLIKNGKSDNDILADINTKDIDALSIKSNTFEKKDNPLVDANWKKGLSDDQAQNGKVVFVNVRKVMQPQPKSLDEARGVITTDYQNYLMNQWVTGLKAKYPVQINKQALSQVMPQ